MATNVLQALQDVIERVQDFEDKVRSRAIAVICEAAIAHPEVSSQMPYTAKFGLSHEWSSLCLGQHVVWALLQLLLYDAVAKPFSNVHGCT